MSTILKTLDDSQVEAFDTEYVDDARWLPLKKLIDRDFPDGEFSFLDVGGGNGVFADRVLESYPLATGAVLDNSELLLGRNSKNQRKKLILESADRLDNLDDKYDVVFINWVLHHLVGDSYRATRSHQSNVLRSAREILTGRGKIAVFENNYSSRFLDGSSSYLIYQLSSSRALSSITRKLGANTAGVGVCFLSRSQWYNSMRNAGLDVLDYFEPDPWKWPLKMIWKAFLQIKDVRCALYWMSSSN